MILRIPMISKNYQTIQEKKDNQIIFALCVVFFLPAINNFINCFFQIGLQIKFSLFTPVSYIFMAFVSVFFLYKFIVKKIAFIAMFVFALLGSVISYILYPEIRSIIYSSPVDLVYSPVNKLFFFCIPVLIGMACVNDYKKLFEKMRIWALVTIIIGVVTYIFVTVINGRILQYMVYSYFLLLPVCICFEYASMNKTKLDFIVAVIGSVSMLACGARGAIVSLFLYFTVCFLRYDFRRMYYGQVIRLFFFVPALCIVLLYYTELLEAISILFEYFNIDSRTIRYITEGNFFEGSGRVSIRDAIKDGIVANPFGYGLFGDRYVVGVFGFGHYQYAHNIFLEMWCDFGVVGGSIIIILLVYFIVRLVFSVRRTNEIYLVLSLIPYAVFQLFFSSSFLENTPFFALMGLAIWGVRKGYFINGGKA